MADWRAAPMRRRSSLSRCRLKPSLTPARSGSTPSAGCRTAAALVKRSTSTPPLASMTRCESVDVVRVGRDFDERQPDGPRLGSIRPSARRGVAQALLPRNDDSVADLPQAMRRQRGRCRAASAGRCCRRTSRPTSSARKPGILATVEPSGSVTGGPLASRSRSRAGDEGRRIPSTRVQLLAGGHRAAEVVGGPAALERRDVAREVLAAKA